MTNKNFTIIYYQTLTESFLTLEAQKIRIMTIDVKKLEKWQKYQKYAKFRAVKILQDIPINLKYIQKPICKP